MIVSVRGFAGGVVPGARVGSARWEAGARGAGYSVAPVGGLRGVPIRPGSSATCEVVSPSSAGVTRVVSRGPRPTGGTVVTPRLVPVFGPMLPAVGPMLLVAVP